MRNPMGLSKACGNCPFRSDRLFAIDCSRKHEIADSLRREEVFPCHKTIRYGDRDLTSEMFCAGALQTMINEGLYTQPMQVAERLGMWDLASFNAGDHFFPSLQEWAEVDAFGFEKEKTS